MKKPLIIHHRINSSARLKKIPSTDGVEIDVRGYASKLVLNHEPLIGGEELEDYLKHFHHAFLIFDIKEAGVETKVIELAQKHHIENYFLLDVEFPYLYQATRVGMSKIAIRFSKDESIETVLSYKSKVDWVWIDTFGRFPLTGPIINQLKGFKTCLVSPDRWGRPQDITRYRRKMDALGFTPDAVMVDSEFTGQWR